MRNILNFLAAMFLLLLLLVAQLYPGSPLFWVASLTSAFTALRYTLVLVLFWFLLRPPQAKWVRVPLGVGALALTGWLIDTTYQGSLGVIDFLAFGTATIAILTSLLESKPREEEFKSVRLALAIYSWTWDRVQVASSWIEQLSWLVVTDLDQTLERFSKNAANDLGLSNGQRHHHV